MGPKPVVTSTELAGLVGGCEVELGRDPPVAVTVGVLEDLGHHPDPRRTPTATADWRITAELDLAATDEAGELVLVTTGFGPA